MICREEGSPMTSHRKTILTITGFTALFLLCGLLHVLLWSVPFTSCFSQLYCGSLCLLWGLTVRRRVTDPRLCRLLLWITFSLAANYTLQLLRYQLVDCAIRRWIWYAYYIPMMAVPLLCLYLSLYIYRPPEEPLKKYWILPGVTGILLTAGILTNDLHFLAFSPSDGTLTGNGDERPEILYYLFLIFFVLSLLGFCFTVLKKSHRSTSIGLRWLPFFLLSFEGLYLLAGYCGLKPKIHGIVMWNFVEVFGFCTVTFLELCIQIGLIPCNQDYEELFSLAELSAVILDMDGQPVYQTRMTEYPFRDHEDIQIVSHPISGGSIQWSIDIHSLNLLNREIQGTIQQIAARNAYLENENTLREEKAKLETQDQLYSRISEIITPQAEQIGQILREIETGRADDPAADETKNPSFEGHLPKIAFLTAYIKRRINLELLSAEGKLPSTELELSVRESLENLKLNGVNTAVTITGDHLYSGSLITMAYEQIQSVLEDCFDTLTDLMIILRAGPGQLGIRMMIRASSFSFAIDDSAPETGSFSRQFSFVRDDPDLILRLTFTEEGEA